MTMAKYGDMFITTGKENKKNESLKMVNI